MISDTFWSKQASDPSKYDLLRKNQMLQKRLVAATQRVAAIEGEVRPYNNTYQFNIDITAIP